MEDGRYLLMKKIIVIVLRKKTWNVSTNLNTESVHPLNSSFDAFQNFSDFQQYKKNLSVVLIFAKRCLMGYVQRSTFTTWSKS